MVEPANQQNQQTKTDQKVWVMKNSLTEQEMDEAEERWATHQRTYMTLAETLACAAGRFKQADRNVESIEIPVVSKTATVIEEITPREQVEFIDGMRQSDAEKVSDTYKDQLTDFNDCSVRANGSSTADEYTSDYERYRS